MTKWLNYDYTFALEREGKSSRAFGFADGKWSPNCPNCPPPPEFAYVSYVTRKYVYCVLCVSSMQPSLDNVHVFSSFLDVKKLESTVAVPPGAAALPVASASWHSLLRGILVSTQLKLLSCHSSTCPRMCVFVKYIPPYEYDLKLVSGREGSSKVIDTLLWYR